MSRCSPPERSTLGSNSLRVSECISSDVHGGLSCLQASRSLDTTNMATAVVTYTRVILLTLSWITALITPHTAAAFSFTDTMQQVKPGAACLAVLLHMLRHFYWCSCLASAAPRR